jgi:transposase-like protein
MDGKSREDLIVKIEKHEGKKSEALRDLDIPRSTYYTWRKAYQSQGLEGVTKTKPSAKHGTD